MNCNYLLGQVLIPFLTTSSSDWRKLKINPEAGEHHGEETEKPCLKLNILCYGLREPTHAVAHGTFKLGTAAELMIEFQLLNVKEAVNASYSGLDSWLGHIA